MLQGATPVGVSCAVRTRSVLLVLLVQNDVQHHANNDEGHGSELHAIDIVPPHEIAEDKSNGAKNHQNDANNLLEGFHLL